MQKVNDCINAKVISGTAIEKMTYTFYVGSDLKVRVRSRVTEKITDQRWLKAAP